MKDIVTEIKGIAAEFKAAQEAQNAEIKKFGQASEATRDQIETLGTKFETLEKELKSRMDEAEAAAKRLGEGNPGKVKSIGAQVIGNEDLKNYKKRAGAVQVKTEIEGKAAFITGDVATAGSLIRPELAAPYITPAAPSVRNLFNTVRTTAPGILVPVIDAYAGSNAGVVPNDGSLKPESDLKTTLVNFPVQTIAHLARVGKPMLDDLPALAGYIDTVLLRGLQKAEDFQLIQGDGTGNNLHGLLSMSTTFTDSHAGATGLDSLRRAAAQIATKFYTADGVVLNPLDFAELELLKTTYGNYVWASVTGPDGYPRIWRMRVAETVYMPQGQYVVGDFAVGGTIYDRQEDTVEVFEQDRDNVARNLITVRAEERLALVIYDQNAFAKGTLPAAK